MEQSGGDDATSVPYTAVPSAEERMSDVDNIGRKAAICDEAVLRAACLEAELAKVTSELKEARAGVVEAAAVMKDLEAASEAYKDRALRSEANVDRLKYVPRVLAARQCRAGS